MADFCCRCWLLRGEAITALGGPVRPVQAVAQTCTLGENARLSTAFRRRDKRGHSTALHFHAGAHVGRPVAARVAAESPTRSWSYTVQMTLWSRVTTAGRATSNPDRATGIPPTNDAEAVVLSTLLPGSYAAIAWREEEHRGCWSGGSVLLPRVSRRISRFRESQSTAPCG